MAVKNEEALVMALLEIAHELAGIRGALRALGNGNAASSMGAIEFLAVQVQEAGSAIAAAIEQRADD